MASFRVFQSHSAFRQFSKPASHSLHTPLSQQRDIAASTERIFQKDENPRGNFRKIEKQETVKALVFTFHTK